MDLLDKAKNIFDWVKSAKMPSPVFTAVATSDDLGLDGCDNFVPDKTYFHIIMNEVFLKDGRQWWASLDPSIYFNVDFIYDKQRQSIPIFVGTETLKAKAGDKLPHGFLINDINIAGPHPFRGDRIGVTAVLYATQTDDFVRTTLKLAGDVSSAIGVPASVDLIEKVGGTILDALETLTKLKGSNPIIGNRKEFSLPQGLSPSYYVLLEEAEVDSKRLKVSAGKLCFEDDRPYRDSNYVLYSLFCSGERQDVRTLKFFDLVATMDAASASNENDGVERAKATLLAIYQQMLICPDLIDRQVDKLFNEYVERLVKNKGTAERIKLLGESQTSESGLTFGPAFNENAARAYNVIKSIN